MKLNLYSIKDIDLDFAQPFCAANDNLALRMFSVVANDKTTQIGQMPSLFSIYCIGEFDSESGNICGLPVPKFIATGNSLVGKIGVDNSEV